MTGVRSSVDAYSAVDRRKSNKRREAPRGQVWVRTCVVGRSVDE
jgi:hypothetical protein